MPKLGLGNTLSKTGAAIPGIVSDGLVLKHKYDAGAVVPVSDGAAYFDSTNYISTPLVGNTVFQNDFTISAWIYRIVEDSHHTIIGAVDGTADEVRLYIQKSSVGSALILAMGPDASAGGARYIHATTDWTGNYDNKWTHVAATYTDGEQKIYINGVDDTDASSIPTRTINVDVVNTFTIGSSSSTSSNDFLGYICNVGVWNVVLTQPQIKSIMWKNYAGLSTSEKTNLVSWWNLDSTIESTAQLGNTVVYDNHNTTLGDNLVANSTFSGGIESPWVDSGTGFPGLGEDAAPSTDQAYIGTHSLKIIGGATSDGTATVFSEPTVVGKLYRFEAWFYVISGVAKLNPGDGPFGAYTPPTDEEAVTTTTNQWEKVVTYAWCDAAQSISSNSLFISCHGGASTFYVDNIKVQIVQGNPGELK